MSRKGEFEVEEVRAVRYDSGTGEKHWCRWKEDGRADGRDERGKKEELAISLDGAHTCIRRWSECG